MGTIRISRFVGMAFLFSAIGQPSDLFALKEHARNGWMLGVSLGSGRVNYEDSTNLALAGTFYPLDRLSPLGGMYVRAGIGSGRITNIITSNVNNIALRYDETGLGLLLGAGYELRVTKKLALGVGVSFDKFSIGGDVYESAQFTGYALDLNWYF